MRVAGLWLLLLLAAPLLLALRAPCFAAAAAAERVSLAADADAGAEAADAFSSGSGAEADAEDNAEDDAEADADADAEAEAEVGVWPANCNAALPRAGDWTSILHHAPSPRVAAVTAILTNQQPRRAPTAQAVALAWAYDEWATYLPRPPFETQPFGRLGACVAEYVQHTLHAQFAADPARFLSRIHPAIAAVSYGAVDGLAEARQLRGGPPGGAAAAGGARAGTYELCDHLAMGQAHGCQQPAAAGDLPLVSFTGQAAGNAQLWTRLADRGLAFHGCTAPRGTAVSVRVVPRVGAPTSALGGAPATFLPWAQNSCTFTIVAARASTAFTPALSGCNVYVALCVGRPPLWIHCNAMGAAGDPLKRAMMDTGAAEIVRRNPGYARAFKFDFAQYRDVPAYTGKLSVTPYGVRTGPNVNSAWIWRAAITMPNNRHRTLQFARWR